MQFCWAQKMLIDNLNIINNTSYVITPISYHTNYTITITRSQSIIVFSRWAIVSTVQVWNLLFIVSWIKESVLDKLNLNKAIVFKFFISLNLQLESLKRKKTKQKRNLQRNLDEDKELLLNTFITVPLHQLWTIHDLKAKRNCSLEIR